MICWDWSHHLCSWYLDATLFLWLRWWDGPCIWFLWKGVWYLLTLWCGQDWSCVQLLLICQAGPIWYVSHILSSADGRTSALPDVHLAASKHGESLKTTICNTFQKGHSFWANNAKIYLKIVKQTSNMQEVFSDKYVYLTYGVCLVGIRTRILLQECTEWKA